MRMDVGDMAFKLKQKLNRKLRGNKEVCNDGNKARQNVVIEQFIICVTKDFCYTKERKEHCPGEEGECDHRLNDSVHWFKGHMERIFNHGD